MKNIILKLTLPFSLVMLIITVAIGILYYNLNAMFDIALHSLTMFFILYFIIALLYLLLKFRSNRVISFIPIIIFIVNILLVLYLIAIFNSPKDQQQVDQKFYNTNVTLMNLDSLYIRSFKNEKAVFFNNAIIEQSDLYLFIKDDDRIVISFPTTFNIFVLSNEKNDRFISKLDCTIEITKIDNSYKGFYYIFDIGAPDVIVDDDKIISSLPNNLAQEYWSIDGYQYEYRPIKEIRIDFAKEIENLDFFKNILLIE